MGEIFQAYLITFGWALSLFAIQLRADDAKKNGPEITEETFLAGLSGAEQEYVNYRLANAGERPALSADTAKQTFKTGQLGELLRNHNDHTFGVSHVIDGRNLLIFGNTIWVEGVKAKDVTDASTISLAGLVFEVKGTKQYRAVSGLTHTVWHLAVTDVSKTDAAMARLNVFRNGREWHDAAGQSLGKRLFIRNDKLMA